MKDSIFTVKSNVQLTRDVWKMELQGDTTHITRPGQFVNLKLEGLFLRRPISVCDLAGDVLTLVYRVVGQGTEQMAGLLPGHEIPVLTGLGNGYDTAKSGDRPLLIGGGVGIPPMYYLAKCLIAEGKKPTAILGFNTKTDLFLVDEFTALGIPVIVTTVDGTEGTKGFVTDGMKDLDYTYFFTCGPMPMFRAVDKVASTSGQFSFEERMGCGFGACMGCSCKTKYGNKRICKDGPVLEREEIIW